MTGFNDAVKMANKLKANHGEVIERTDCFIFKGVMFDLSSCPLVVMKNDGRCLQYMDWMRNNDDSHYVKSHKYKNGEWNEFVDSDEE